MSTTMYKGFRIRALPYQLFDSRRCTADLEIRRGGRSQPISVDQRYSSEHEAEAHCSTVARLIIDRGMPRWSVDGLRSQPTEPRSFTRFWREARMRPYLLAGIVLLGIGAFVLLRGASFTSRENVLSVGDVSITAEERQTIPPWVGAGALMAGVVLVVAGMRKKS
jgi:hypothetical protein